MRVDAIVNAANSSLLGGGGVDGAIHRAAGPELLAECRTLHGCATGDAKITKGYRLPAQACDPCRRAGLARRQRAARMNCSPPAIAARSSFARSNGLASVAFPAISTGVYRFPADRAAGIAVATVVDALAAAPDVTSVIFCCFSGDSAQLHEAALAAFGSPCAD